MYYEGASRKNAELPQACAFDRTDVRCAKLPTFGGRLIEKGR